MAILVIILCFFFFFFFNDTATTEIYTLSLHDALPISSSSITCSTGSARWPPPSMRLTRPLSERSEEHTSELQSRQYLVCRLLLEKKKKNKKDEQQMKRELHHFNQSDHGDVYGS